MKKLVLVLLAVVLILAGCKDNKELVEIEPMETGADCPTGGYRIYSGIDQDEKWEEGFGILDEDEITDTFYIYNGLDGKDIEQSLVDFSDLDTVRNVQAVFVPKNRFSRKGKMCYWVDENVNGVFDENEYITFSECTKKESGELSDYAYLVVSYNIYTWIDSDSDSQMNEDEIISYSKIYEEPIKDGMAYENDKIVESMIARGKVYLSAFEK